MAIPTRFAKYSILTPYTVRKDGAWFPRDGVSFTNAREQNKALNEFLQVTNPHAMFDYVKGGVNSIQGTFDSVQAYKYEGDDTVVFKSTITFDKFLTPEEFLTIATTVLPTYVNSSKKEWVAVRHQPGYDQILGIVTGPQFAPKPKTPTPKPKTPTPKPKTPTPKPKTPTPKPRTPARSPPKTGQSGCASRGQNPAGPLSGVGLRKQMLAFHPDKNPSCEGEAKMKFQELLRLWGKGDNLVE